MITRFSWRAALRRCRWALLVALLPNLSAEDVIVRTELTPEKVWVGQRMQLQIDVLGKDGWAQIADLSELEVPGSYVRPAGNSRVRLNETINGESYTGQRYELSIYPQRSGEQELPSIDLLVKVQTWGAQNSTEPIEASTEAISFTASLPAGADPSLPLVVSDSFVATQTWEPDQSEFEVGEALRRSIRLKAKDLPAMVLPPLSSAKVIDGLSIYPETPEILDTENRGTRQESVTYVFEQNALAGLPSYALQWWNPETETLELIQLEGRDLTITGGAQLAAEVEEAPRYFKTTYVLLTVSGVAVAFFLFIRFKKREKQCEPHEPAVFRKVLTAAKCNDSVDTLNGLVGWLHLVGEGPSRFFESYADTSTRATATQLLRDPRSVTQLADFASGLKQARKNYRATRSKSISKADHALPPLNL